MGGGKVWKVREADGAEARDGRARRGNAGGERGVRGGGEEWEPYMSVRAQPAHACD